MSDEPIEEELDNVKGEPEKSKKAKDSDVYEDKIFNNSYNTGGGLKGDDYRFTNGIKVDDEYSSKYLKDVYDYENQVEYKIILDEIIRIIEKDSKLSNLIEMGSDTKKKFNSEQINIIFSHVYDTIENDIRNGRFMNSIYIVEAISNITKLDYKKIFDFLDYKYREILLVDLNKKYKFLDGKMNFKDMF